jgi:PAS domain S-box-containing protein
MLKRELLAELSRLEALIVDDQALGRAVHDFQAQREALTAQQEELDESRRLLEASRDRYADLFEFAPIGYALLDKSGIVQDLNLAGANLLGSERAGLIDFPFLSFIAKPERRAFLECLRRRRRNPEPEEIEVTLRQRSGGTFPAQLTVKRALSTATQSLGFHVAIVDVSERKLAEAERQRAEDERRQSEHREQLARAASEAKDRFIAVLSHELRTPLAPIVLAIASLEHAGKVPQALAPTLAMIRRNVELETRLIDDLLDMTRITQGKLRLKLEAVDAHAIVEDVITLCADDARAAGIEPVRELAATEHHVLGDATRLRQVVWNLLRNAIQHTPRDGRITIQSANEPPGRLKIVVNDTGTGIPPAKLEQMFRPFEQGDLEFERASGLGLGLAICKGIVEAHGGCVDAASPGDGKGATFTVDLATAVATAAPRSDSKRTTQLPTRRKKILLVEDDRDNASAVAELLRLNGYEVDSADSVETALRKAQNGFDVLVSDIRLPDGSGRDVLRELGGRGRVQAIAVTGYGTREDVRNNIEAGFSRHLTKPVAPEELLAAVGELAESAPNETMSEASPPRRRRH